MALKEIRKLLAIAEKPSRLIIGLMSGTSLDGLDIALCRLHGSGPGTQAELLAFETVPYHEAFKKEIREVFAQRNADLEKVCLLNAYIADIHAGYILDALKRWQIDTAAVDCIASHGQTIYHAPKRFHLREGYPDATLQVGDGDHIAVRTGIITISDFRQKHIAGGGEGAPLALYGDHLLFSSPAENRILLNMGGISNFTFLPASGDRSAILSTDTGPGNTLIDACMQKYFGLTYDEDGKTASSGTIHEALLEELLRHPFFQEQMPKTTGPELFNLDFLESALARSAATELPAADLLATVTRFTAVSVTNAMRQFAGANTVMYASGGGCHNMQLVSWIKELMPGVELREFTELGIHPDAKEAVLFAVLANETLAGEITRLGNNPAVTMGKISLPDVK